MNPRIVGRSDTAMSDKPASMDYLTRRKDIMYEIHVNMRQLDKFQVYDDSVIAFDQIVQSKGKFITDRPDIYTRWLNEFGIFYTMKGKV